MKLEELQSKNPGIRILPLTDPSFSEYGTVIQGYSFTDAYRVMETKEIPASGNTYTACDPDLQALPLATELSEGFYGGMPVQLGFCNGRGTGMNALEYHKGTEVDGCCTDLVLLLAKTYEIRGNVIPSDCVKAYFAPAGTVVELYGTTLHYAPCAVSDDGFRCIIGLPEGTNAALPEKPAPRNDEDKLLWMKNKWLIAHKDSSEAADGAVAGIEGVNITIRY